jgi:putative hydrolase of the HAD superfamily
MTGAPSAAIKWIAFDLDDTLHFYRNASGEASAAVFAYLHEEFGCDAQGLGAAYAAILKGAQTSGFAEGKSSREYRAERFGKLLASFSIKPHRHLDTVLDVYDDALSRNLKLKEGAAEALRECKLSGYSVMIVTEGPQDAQEATLERLGIAQYADLLVTSGRERVSKCGGLLKRALEMAACAPDELIYIGDSLVSDILPAMVLGVRTIYVGQEDQIPEGVQKISSLLQLRELLPG